MQYVRHVLCFVFRTTVDRKCSRPMLIPAANGTGRDRMEPILATTQEFLLRSRNCRKRAEGCFQEPICRIGALAACKDAQSKSGNTETSLHAHKTVKINQYYRRRPNHRDTLAHLCLRLHSLHLSLVLSLVHPIRPNHGQGKEGRCQPQQQPQQQQTRSCCFGIHCCRRCRIAGIGLQDPAQKEEPGPILARSQRRRYR